jgi:hypothetical protein
MRAEGELRRIGIQLAAAAATVGLVSAVTVAVAAATTEDDPGTLTDLVALGDSYAAGVGGDDPLPEPDAACRRNGDAYPVQLATMLEDGSDDGSPAVDLHQQACSGATTVGVVTGVDDSPRLDGTPRGYRGPQQVTAVTEDTDVVTLTVGGGDTDFEAALRACLTAPGTCAGALASSAALYDPQRLVDLLAEVDRAAGDRDAEDRVQVLVTGYPAPFDTAALAAGTCRPGLITPSVAAAEALNEAVRGLNARIAATVVGFDGDDSVVGFVDVDAVFEGRRICSSESWLVEPSPSTSQVTWLHPTTTGHGAYARALDSALTVAPAPTPTGPVPSGTPSVVIPTAVPAG